MTDQAGSAHSVLPVRVIADEENSSNKKRDPPGRESDAPNRDGGLPAEDEIVEDGKVAPEDPEAEKVGDDQPSTGDLNVENGDAETEKASQEKTKPSVESPAADSDGGKPPPAEESPMPDSQPAPPEEKPVVVLKDVPTNKLEDSPNKVRAPSKIKRTRIVAAKSILSSPSPALLRKRPARKSIGGIYPKKAIPMPKKAKPATKAKDKKASAASKVPRTKKTGSGKATPPKKKATSAKKSASKTSLAKSRASGKTLLAPEGPFVDGSARWPTGWTLEKVERKGGATTGRVDRYWYSPVAKKKFRSKAEIRRFQEALKKCGGDEEKAFKAM